MTSLTKPAIFLDRDGVLNPLIWDPRLVAYDSPFRPDQVSLLPGVTDTLRFFLEAGYLLVLASNQPGAAKGKCRLDDLEAVHATLEGLLNAAGVFLAGTYYCYHHPEGVIPELRQKCSCRKPGDLLLKMAQKAHGIDMAASWMIGDRDSDVLCGRRAGAKTILLHYPPCASYRSGIQADYSAPDIRGARDIIRRLEIAGPTGTTRNDKI